MTDTGQDLTDESAGKSLDFIRQMVVDDLEAEAYSRVVTRFPPEPNGFLHMGHAKSICLNFGIAGEVAAGKLGQADATCHLRFDDTNPTKEEQLYIDAIKRDIRWLGFDWGDHEYYASDYFETLFEWACLLIEKGQAYVDDQNADQIRESRGTLTTPGVPSPCRDRSPQDSLELFHRMRGGEFPDGARVLRAKIDMASPNINMRDPVMYRILHAEHPRTGNTWCLYPMYDWAHGQSDWIEGITHSVCTLEFEAHRPLYEWFIDRLQEAGVKIDGRYPAAANQRDEHRRPKQREFAKLQLSNTVMSKRNLRAMVSEGIVDGWDDPRMPTLSGKRRLGYTPEAIREFCEGVGVAKRENTIELARLEFHLRSHLNKIALRRMAVLDPIKIVITNYPEGQVEMMDAVNNPEDNGAGSRAVPFSRELYIERDDFMEDPPKKFFRLGPGREVRLRYGYWVTCQDYVKDDAGNITELHCTYDPQTKGGNAPPPDAEGKVRKVKGTLHWVSAEHAVDAEVRLYDQLFKDDEEVAALGDSPDIADTLNPDSLTVVSNAKLEPALAESKAGQALQFERIGYFVRDSKNPEAMIFNRTVGLRDSWAKANKNKPNKKK